MFVQSASKLAIIETSIGRMLNSINFVLNIEEKITTSHNHYIHLSSIYALPVPNI